MDLNANAQYTSPLPISDLHRMQLYYQTATPVSSVVSSQDDIEYHWSTTSQAATDYSSVHSQQNSPYVQALHLQTYPQDYPPHSAPPRSHASEQQLLQSRYISPKLEYDRMIFNMADIPQARGEDMLGDGADAVLEMDQDKVDEIIRNKRKLRDPKACYACHRRKVKCDRNLPCDSCVKRDHPQLCSYERPTKKRRIALSTALAQAESANSDSNERLGDSGPNITVPREQWERMKLELAQLKEHAETKRPSAASMSPLEGTIPTGVLHQSDELDREGVHAPSTQMGTMHLGSRSVLAYMLGDKSKSTRDAARSLLEKNILPNLGLDNETLTYPFVDLWSTDASICDVASLIKTLPDDALIREFWLTYRDIPCTIYPVVPDCNAFEQTLDLFLHTRQRVGTTDPDIDPDKPYGVPMSWLALLFAVLASGSQSTGRAAKERELTSQVYICCSYQALRMSNFLTHPSLNTMQALLIIGNALSYNMNPGVSYILLGMTIRSAFTIGLHVQQQSFSERDAYQRGRIWWALAWQDSHFSVSYDRPSSSMLCRPEIPYEKHSRPGLRSYVESMSAIIRLTQDILRERILNSQSAFAWAQIQNFRDEINRIWLDALPRLRDRNLCISMTDHLERLAITLHCSYLASEVCRPALGVENIPNTPHANSTGPTPASDGQRRKDSHSSQPNAHSPVTSPSDPEIVQHLRAECIKNLQATVETYVELRSINKFGARSWIGIQRSITSAFMLGILPETQHEPKTIRLLTELERGIEQAALEDSAFPDQPDSASTSSVADRTSEESPLWVKSMTGSLKALSRLNAALSGEGEMASQQEDARHRQQFMPPPLVTSHPQSYMVQHGQRQQSPTQNTPTYHSSIPRSSGIISPPDSHSNLRVQPSYQIMMHSKGRPLSQSPDRREPLDHYNSHLTPGTFTKQKLEWR